MQTFFEGYANYLSDDFSKNTVASYMCDLKKFISEFNIKTVKDVREVNNEKINNYIMLLKNRGMSYSTLSRHIASLKKFFSYCRKSCMKTI